MSDLDLPAPAPLEKYPLRVPIKIIGRDCLLDHSAITSIILGLLGEQDRTGWRSNLKGPYASHTFWVVLPDERAEGLLRSAIHALPGVLMQL